MSLKRNTSSLEWVAAITLVVAAGGNASQVSHIVGASCKIAAGGVQVVVVGFGFGPVQGKGAVWLGTAFGRVVSWSDTRINATAARNATFGKIRVRQDGVWSNAVPFDVGWGKYRRERAVCSERKEAA